MNKDFSIEQRKAVRHLSKDAVMKKIIKNHGPLANIRVPASYFMSVSRIIVGQQLSVAAARTIWGRCQNIAKPWTAAAVLSLSDEDLRSCGLSRAKCRYLRELALRVEEGSLNFSKIKKLPKEDAAKELLSIKGFGQWSVEMFQVSVLRDPDIFSPQDVGLQRAMCLHYGVAREDFKDSYEAITELWKPYRSYASRYLWASLDNAP